VAREGGRSDGSGGLTAAGGDFVQLVIAYAKQETVGSLQALGRFVVFGVLGSTAIALGAFLVLLALLRALQTETGSTFTGNLSWLPYLITGGVAAAVLGLAAWRISKGSATRKMPDGGNGRQKGRT
jgi:hypothetical protein